uniref:Ig-like domain-containing protein n=1 Tax=Amphilophus citrinellus TaxID=61819 RepID=A0A3Q0SXL0_AMPCI
MPLTNPNHTGNIVLKDVLKINNFPSNFLFRFTGNMLNRGWSFTAPRSIPGLKGSCLVIPCKFSYSNSQPKELEVIWYLYQSNGYPAVFNQRGDVTSKFNGRTSLIGSVAEQNCSLKIERLEMSHNHDRLYPWIDKNSITGHCVLQCPFQEITMNEPPGELTEGMATNVICSVIYKCKKNAPTIIWNYKDMQNSLNTKQISVKTYNIVSNLTFIPSLSDDGKPLTCTAQFITGESSSSVTLTVKSEFLHMKTLLSFIPHKRSLWDRLSR